MLLRLIPLLLLVLLPAITQAYTTYEMQPYTSTVNQTCNTQNTCDPFTFKYRVPVGVMFDRVQMSVPSTTTSITGTNSFQGYIYDDGTIPYESCTGSDHSCDNDDTLLLTMGLSPTKSNPSSGVIQFIYASSTLITDSNWFFKTMWDPNTFPSTYNYNITASDIGSQFNTPNDTDRVNQAPTLKFCMGACDDNTFYEPIVFSGDYITKFTGVNSFAYSTTTQTFSFNVTQLIETDELVPSLATRNITNHYVTYNYSTNTSQFTSQGINFTPTDGNSTTSISVTDTLFGTDGTYTFKVAFGNSGTGITGVTAFPETYIYFNFKLTGGLVSNFQADEPYTPQSFTPGTNPALSCSIFEPWECIKSLAIYLIIPPANTLGTLAWYNYASSSPSTGFISAQSVLLQNTLGSVSSSTDMTSLNMSLPVSIGNATITLPIISFTGAYDKLPTVFDFLRLICLAVLVLFALSVYVGNVQRAWHMISYRGLDH